MGLQKADNRHVVGCKTSVPGCVSRPRGNAELCQTVSAVTTGDAMPDEMAQWRYVFAGDLNVPVSVYPSELLLSSPRVRTAEHVLASAPSPFADQQFLAWYVYFVVRCVVCLVSSFAFLRRHFLRWARGIDADTASNIPGQISMHENRTMPIGTL